MKYLFAVALMTFSHIAIQANENSRFDILKKESQAILEKSLIVSQFYTLEAGEDFKEITQSILVSPHTQASIKNHIIATERRFFIFSYPSDGFLVKGSISFVPNSYKNNLLIFLRGGNKMFGLMHPANDYTCMKDYTVLSTAYRGGISEGTDEFGGNEVNDVEHLIEYLPILEQKLQIQFYPENTFMLGGSRGGMEMFLALSKSPSLQQKISKIVSLSGLLDMQECIRYREDMKNMFIRSFGLIPEVNEESWIDTRNPINTASKIRKDLPILIIQGSEDLRVHLNEGYHMVKSLKENNCRVDYLEIQGGNHCLYNQENRIDLITEWLEK